MKKWNGKLAEEIVKQQKGGIFISVGTDQEINQHKCPLSLMTLFCTIRSSSPFLLIIDFSIFIVQMQS